MTNHYDKKYYEWQKKSGVLGGMLDTWKFQPFIKSTDTVLDFGCGGGYILEHLICRRRWGVDINPVVRKEAQKKEIHMVPEVFDIPKSVQFDVVISHHTLEHLENPAEILKELKKRTRKGGYAVHVVPINDWRNDKKYNPDDINKHLYTWTPLLIGNLFSRCGYRIQSVEIITRTWFPLSIHYYSHIPNVLLPVYNLASWAWGLVLRSRQIRIVART